MVKSMLFVILLSFAITPSVFATDEMRLVIFCTSCHGTDGGGPGETIPNIGGQTQEYLSISMDEINKKERYSTMMSTITKGYTPDELAKISKWFATKKWKNSENTIDKTLASKGKALAESCWHCHGDNGEGDDKNPRIAGQHSKYLYYSMLEYKNKVRNNNGSASEMDEITTKSDDELKALAEYFSSLR